MTTAPAAPGPVTPVLVGLPGVGKSAVAACIADQIGATAVDLDAEIVAACGRSIPEIFAADGEAGFRAHELAALDATLRRAGAGERAVVAAGGGIVTTAAARHRLRSGDVCCVWLTGSLEMIRDRLGTDATPRPLLADADALTRLWHERRRWYLGVSDHVIATDRRSPQQVAALVKDRLAP